MEDVIAEEAQSLYRRIRQRAQENENNQVAMSRIFSPVACNVIWRFVTGKRSSQDDPELQKLTEAGKHIFRFFEAGSLLRLAQLHALWVAKLCHWVGYKVNVIDVPKVLQQMIYKEAESGNADQEGSYVERHWYMQEKHKDDRRSVFSKHVGMDNLKGALWDMFLAGN